MKIAVACDHGGLALKNVLLEYLKKNGYEIMDFGTCTPMPVLQTKIPLSHSPLATASAAGRTKSG